RVAFLVDQERRGARDDDLENGFPDAQQVVEDPLELLDAAADARRAYDAAHAIARRELLERLAPDLPVSARHQTRSPPGARIVRHQHEETAGQAHIGRERRALRAALLLLDLDDDFLVLAQNVLDLDLLARLGLFDEILGRDLLQGQK